MGWKKWPYWLRGGIIAVIILLLLLPLVFISDFFLYFFAFLILVLSIPILLVTRLVSISIIPRGVNCFDVGGGGNCTSFYSFLYLLLAIIDLFIIGAIIGWIIGKIKKK